MDRKLSKLASILIPLLVLNLSLISNAKTIFLHEDA